MTVPVTLDQDRVQEAITLLGLCKPDNRSAGIGICNAVATLLASAEYGSTTQQNLMDAARRAGFIPEYYVRSIRVYRNA